MEIIPGVSRTNTKPTEISLANIHVASPCPAEWSKMAGDERVRHCAECNLNVYNLSAMTEREIERLLNASHGQRLCARFYRRADGTVLTQDCPWNLRVIVRKASRLATAFLTALLSVNFALAKSKTKPVCECQQNQQKDSGLKLTVMDQHGAVIPGAEITLKKKSDTQQLTGVTGPAGEWNTIQIAPGEYNITVQSRGFRTFNSLIAVHDGMLLGLKVTLPVAAVSTTVTVEAAPVEIMGAAVGIITSKNSPGLPPSSSGGQHSLMRP
jgi:hypothetical protein